MLLNCLKLLLSFVSLAILLGYLLLAARDVILY